MLIVLMERIMLNRARQRAFCTNVLPIFAHSRCPERPGVIINTIKCNLISGPGLGYHKRIIRDRNPARASPRIAVCFGCWRSIMVTISVSRLAIDLSAPPSGLTPRVEALMITSTSGSATRYRDLRAGL